MEENKIIYTCTAVLLQLYQVVRKERYYRGVGIPSLITCNEIIPGACPWYIRTPEEDKKGKEQKGKEKKEKNENK